MLTQLLISIRLLAVFTVLTGIAYPVAMTAVAQAVFPAQANGNLVSKNGKAVGSWLIGQPFSDPKYFWGRLSATTPAFNGASSSGSNLGPLNPILQTAVHNRVAALRTADPSNTELVPVDLATASGSGLDPHISPAAAAYQAGRVARARGLPESVVRGLVARYTQPRAFGLLGEPGVNVLLLNLALDELSLTT